ncbi:MmgE/PrpD family protein [Prauserella cavernicola]|uniref:MmgE/PrpD family protein n=1 Tax=Prauserella cavernicola TaxID=2800127 RepID=A0A934QWK4_9PSEU|nr:MmgE/PrpD family protein [Prauserella cavernicola]MBK1786629.1 MmgE/PrpD family protein [Prauserella cavernicola]
MDSLAGLVSADWQHVSQRARQQVRLAFLDVVAVALAAIDDPPQVAVAGHLGRSGPGSVAVPGMRALSAQHAATGWGSLAHARDFDDVSEVLHGHPSAVLVPAVLALGHREGATGAELVDAYLSGYEALGRISAGASDEQRARGWHTTSTIGVFGATVAAARMLGLTPHRTRHALGIAASLAGGIQANFGSPVKPLHAGWAAGNGVQAAELAAAGIDAGPAALDLRASYLEMFGGTWREHAGPPHIEAGLRFKPYPCCGSATGLVDCAIDLHRLVVDGPGLDAIESVACSILPQTDRTLRYRAPATGDQARFSPEFCVAQGLSRGGLEEWSFRDGYRESRGELDALMRRVSRRLVAEDELPHNAKDVEVMVRFTGGRTVVARSKAPKGHPDNPMTRGDLEAKFESCTERVLDPGVRGELIARLSALDDEPRAAALVDDIVLAVSRG